MYILGIFLYFLEYSSIIEFPTWEWCNIFIYVHRIMRIVTKQPERAGERSMDYYERICKEAQEKFDLVLSSEIARMGTTNLKTLFDESDAVYEAVKEVEEFLSNPENYDDDDYIVKSLDVWFDIIRRENEKVTFAVYADCKLEDYIEDGRESATTTNYYRDSFSEIDVDIIRDCIQRDMDNIMRRMDD